MAESIINSGLTKEMLDMTYPDKYYKNTIQPAKAGTGPVPSKTQMMYQNLKSGGPFKAMRIGMDPYLPEFMQQGYDKFRAAPTSAARTALGAGSGILRTAASLPMQAAMAGPYAISKAMAPSVAAGDFVNDEQFQLGQSEVGVGDFYSGNTNLLSDAEKAMMADQYDVGYSFADNERITPNIPGNVPSNFVDAGRDFSMFDQARMGNEVLGNNVQGKNYEMDQSFYMNPNSVERPQNMFQRAGSAIKEGIGSLTELELEDYLPFIGEKSLTGMAMGGVGKVGRGILSLFNAPYRGATRGGGGYTIDQLNRQNARGGYYTDTARSQRRDAASIQNMINRAASGKNYGANRLNTLGKEAGMSSEDISRAITDRKTAAPSHIGNENTTGTGGGKIVCTMMNDSYGFGSFRNKIWMKFHKDIAPEYQKGYHKLFLPLVKIAKTNKIVKKVLEHIAVHSTIDMRQATRGKIHLLGRVYRKIIKPICFIVGKALMFRQKR